MGGYAEQRIGAGGVRSNDVVFASDFATGLRDDGTSLRFTRMEARGLAIMLAHPGILLSRATILDRLEAFDDDLPERGDRSIDFLITRLRRKLGCSARNPRFIASRYGEGYIWIAPVAASAPDLSGVQVVIGPLRCAPKDLVGMRAIATTLARQIERHLDTPGAVAVVEQGPPATMPPNVQVVIELTAQHLKASDKAVLIARSTKTGRVSAVTRVAFGTSGGLREFASHLMSSVWLANARAQSDDDLVQLALHEEIPSDRDAPSWRANDARLMEMDIDGTDDPDLKLIHAVHLHNKYILTGLTLFRKGEETCKADERVIERRVLDVLDYVQDRPNKAIVAGKLLYFVDTDYAALSRELIENAVQHTTAVGPSLAVAGQFYGFLGKMDLAVDYLEQAVALADHGSKPHLYALVQLCQMLAASQRREELATRRAELYKLSKLGSVFFAPMMGDPDRPSLRVRAAVAATPRAVAAASLKHLNYIWARLHLVEAHRSNALRAPVHLFTKKYGHQILPPGLLDTMPTLAEELRRK